MNHPSKTLIPDHGHLITGYQSVHRAGDPNVVHVCGCGQLNLGPQSCWNLLELIEDCLVCLDSSASGSKRGWHNSLYR